MGANIVDGEKLPSHVKQGNNVIAHLYDALAGVCDVPYTTYRYKTIEAIAAIILHHRLLQSPG